MRVGITVDDSRTVVAEARRAEALGFDILGCGEYLFFHGPTPNSFAMLAAAADQKLGGRQRRFQPAPFWRQLVSVARCVNDGDDWTFRRYYGARPFGTIQCR
jgi:hypothetical protein